MNYNSQPEFDCDKAKMQVLVELNKTSLGKALIAYLQQNDIELKLTVKGHVVEREYGGFYDVENRIIFLNANLDMPQILHCFAHEIRHVAQLERDRASPDKMQIWTDPASHFYAVRLREMDADAFATYFIYNHSIKTKENTFNELLNSQKTQIFDRIFLYQAFYRSWEESKGKDIANATLLAGVSFLENRSITAFYNSYAIESWRKAIWDTLVHEPDSGFAQAFRKAVAKPLKNSRHVFIKQAAGYAKIFSDLGVPNYLKNQSLEKFASFIESVNYSSDIEKKITEACEDFEKAREHYARPLKHNSLSR